MLSGHWGVTPDRRPESLHVRPVRRRQVPSVGVAMADGCQPGQAVNTTS
ncbi:hypothetical protein MSMEI_1765 [Mycolicibacterium smegmatis MC2 155]|uniref:Uncharacterized protein n=1 Tax=Mycolicibacterium smegmatis (strain ATCC 700084 / mc(2)155) TaxID=246196 RepID=I7FYU4_MYCS2|nr:hypothetical protein MSMEI_1765 [Mycolicibacterium smegmatis MC2 155]